MRTTLWLAAAAGLAILIALAGTERVAAQARKTLDIYVVDVEGGNATLFLSPADGSVLIDTGNLAPEAMPMSPMTPPQPGPAVPPPPAHNGPAHWFKVSAQSDGSFTVTNSRNGFSKTYAAAR